MGKRKRTRREIFLAEMVQVAPLSALLALRARSLPEESPPPSNQSSVGPTRMVDAGWVERWCYVRAMCLATVGEDHRGWWSGTVIGGREGQIST